MGGFFICKKILLLWCGILFLIEEQEKRKIGLVGNDSYKNSQLHLIGKSH